MKILIVGIFAELIDLAIHLQDEGHDVYYYIDRKGDKGIGKGLIKLVKGWKQLAEEADLIIFPDVYFGDLPLKYREKGKLVIGGSALSDRLENDREFATKIYDRFGLKYPKTWRFTSFNEAIEFVKKNPNRYVLKPMGQKPRFYTYIAEDDEDMIVALKHFKDVWPGKSDFILQEYVEGVEIACTGFFNGEKFLKPFIVNFEEKRIGEGNRGPNSGEVGCYDKETEVLTRRGWKFFKDVTSDDEICTINPKTLQIEYQKPTAIVKYFVDMPMIHWKNTSLDLFVTPNHNMWVSIKGQNTFQFLPAEKVASVTTYYTLRTGKWEGQEIREKVLPARKCGTISLPEHRIDGDTWVQLLAAYLADGSKTKRQVMLAAKKQRKIELYESIVKKLPFNYFISKDKGLVISSVQLADALPNEKCKEKYIPDEIKSASQRQIELFLEIFLEGDGHRRKTGNVYYTSSPKLADDIQELLMKCGRVGIIRRRERDKVLWIKDHWARSDGVHFEIDERKKKTRAWFDKRDVKIEHYRGWVYCVEVPNHVMYVRRNYKPVWCGNTTIVPQMKCKLAQQTIQKLSPFLKLADFRGTFDLNMLQNDKGIWILEATCFPESTQIQTLDGWKDPNNLQIGDLALTLNLKTNKIEYHPVENILVFKYDGPICVFGNNYLEFATTPDHDILHVTDDHYTKTKAQNLLGKKIKPVLSAEKDGLNKDVFELLPVTDGNETLTPPLSLKTKDLLYFLGLYIADGWHDAGRVYLRRQYRPEITAKILKRLENFPFPIDKIENWIVIRSIQLVNFLDQLGFERGKILTGRLIPPSLFQFSSELLYNLVEGLSDGDGSPRYEGRRFYTASRELAEQVAMLYLYLGLSPLISVKRHKPPLYTVYGASPEAISHNLKVKEDYYKGYVWCPVVPPHHTILAREGNRPFFNFQCRPGIPTIHIIDGLMQGEWGETLVDIASGRNTVIPLREEWCVGVVMMSPPWPYEMRTDKYSDFPLSFPWELVERRLIHPGDIKAKVIDKRVLLTTAGSVGFTLVATGRGKTIDDAQRMVYNRVLPKVKFSLGWYRTDIGDRVKKKLGYLKKLRIL